jgi:hypothetical protein
VLARGESIAGGLGRKLDVIATMKATGVSPKMMKRMGLLADLTPTEFEALLKRTNVGNAIDEAFDRELRSLIRARELNSERL